MLIKYITLISGFYFLVFALVLMIKKSPIKRANIILGSLFLFMTTYSLVLYYLYSASYSYSYDILSRYIPLDFPLLMLMGPAIYFYVRRVINRPLAARSLKTWLHAVPALPAIVFAIYFACLPVDVRVQKLTINFDNAMWQCNMLNGLFYIQVISYLTVCYLTIRKQLAVSRKITVGSVQLDIYWLRTFFMIDLSIMVITAPIIFYYGNDRINTFIGLLAMDIQFVYVFLKSAWQTSVVQTETLVDQEAKLQFGTMVQPEAEEPQKPILKIAEDQADEYFTVLVRYIQNKKPYLDENCSIQDVSVATDIPVHHLSNVINQRLKKNFADFVNEYRVEDAKELLRSSKSNALTMEAVGYECGFGSKKNFYNAFRKFTGSTPLEYQQSGK